ncbi:MAG: DNA-binding response regulator [Cytophagales bacterium]|nr:MAG: DNA-binding response regulator [Cytophagales bacterium]
MRVVIIEDEKLTAKDLAKTLVAIDADIEIVTTIYSVEEGLLFFQNTPELDLIFSDIELGDGLSSDIFQKHQNTTPIIFCTAYQQYTLDAFKTAGIDYVLKPFSKVTIEKALMKFKSLKEKFEKPSTDLSNIYASLRNTLLGKTASIIVHQGDKIIPISGNDIALFYIENENVFAFTFEQKKYLVNQKLESLEKTFPDFFRVNRQFLINRKAVKDASQYFNRKMLANLTIPFKEQIIIGKLKTTEFIQWLANT